MSPSASPAARLLALAAEEDLHVFHDRDGALFARNGTAAWALDDPALGDHLAALYHEREEETLTPSQVATALRVLRGQASEQAGEEDDLAAAALFPPRRAPATEGSRSVGPTAEEDSSLVGEPLAELLVRAARLVKSHVAMTNDHAVTVALWTAHTHALAAVDITPYLAVTSPERRSGKSLLLELLELLVARPLPAANISTAALAHLVQAEQPTLLLDEVDAIFKRGREQPESAETLRGILNAGFQRGRPYVRMAGQGAAMEPARMEVFCPKVFAGIGRALPDTLMDRSINIRLARKTRQDRVARFRRRRVKPQADPLRVALAAWAGDAVEALCGAEPELPEALHDRAQDCWEPLLAIADRAGDNWPERAREAALKLSGSDDPEDDSLGVRLLADVRTVLRQPGAGDRTSSKLLVTALLAIEDAPWSDLYGKGLTARRLAELLRPFGIAPQTVRLDDDTTPKGYLREEFADAWERYLPAEQGGA